MVMTMTRWAIRVRNRAGTRLLIDHIELEGIKQMVSVDNKFTFNLIIWLLHSKGNYLTRYGIWKQNVPEESAVMKLLCRVISAIYAIIQSTETAN